MELKEKLNGFLLINKPKDISSYDCIRHIKRIVKEKFKIGHTGTLDNFATGLLILALGKGTKHSNLLMNLNKEYVATGQLGKLTETLDNTGKTVEITDATLITEKDLTNVITQFEKSYFQVPPLYSALKHKGQPLYKLTREKKPDPKVLEEITKQKSREINIYNLELTNLNLPFFTIQTTVSKGTYIRSLVNDIAQKLNLPATTHELTRTKIGPISLRDSINLNDIKTIEDIIEKLIDIEDFKQKIEAEIL